MITMSSNSVDLKVLLLGKDYVGKSALMERFLHERFLSNSNQITIGAAYGSKRLAAKCGHQVVLGVWDTAGSETYESIARIYYRDAGAAIICYELTDDYSLEKAKFWAQELQKYTYNCRIYVCGCKLDLVPNRGVNDRLLLAEAAASFAQSLGAFSIETSSKTGENVQELFDKIVNDFAEVQRQQQQQQQQSTTPDSAANGFSLRQPRHIAKSDCACTLA